MRAPLLAAWLAAGAALGQAPQEAAEVRQRLLEIQSRLVQVDQQVATLKKRRKGVLVELQGISLQAERARAQADGARLQRDQTLAEVQAIGSRKGELLREIASLRTELRKQIRWMQALGPWGALSFLPSIASFQDFLVQGRYLAWWRNRERQRLARVQGLQGELDRRELELREALHRLRREEQAAEGLQADLRTHEERIQAFLEGLSQDEGRQKAVQAELAEEALQLERLLATLLGKPKGEAFEPTTAFTALRGELPQPVAGGLAQAFGEHLHPKFHTRTFRSGLLIQAPSGTPVQAVAEGRVVHAEPYQSYGPMVILDHGGGYFTIYAHLRNHVVTRGQVLRTGETLGFVGETLEGPRLAFEVRQQTQPQDPQKWFKVKYR
jgi:murein hydrolase activator